MNDLTVYIGSDHVIQYPEFDFRKSSLSITIDSATAAKQACKRNAAGMVNTYRLNADSLVAHDLTIQGDAVILHSEAALDALMFLGASFVHK